MIYQKLGQDLGGPWGEDILGGSESVKSKKKSAEEVGVRNAIRLGQG